VGTLPSLPSKPQRGERSQTLGSTPSEEIHRRQMFK
jgi:hypothetical protein